MTIEEIRLTVNDAFLAFAEEYDRYTKGATGDGSTMLLNEVETYLGRHKGKQLRPLLVLLSAAACGKVTRKHVLMATAMELLHNATLMHDDVVDESDERRGDLSVRKRWGNQVAVLCGDFFLSQVMAILQEAGVREASAIVDEAVATMIRGELAQLYWTARDGVSQSVYIDVIGCKTAALMASCCELGALPMEDGQETTYREALRDYGYHYGLVFQMRDDLADGQTRHDIRMTDTSGIEALIATHKQLAAKALSALPDGRAREALRGLLDTI